jgi:hypothetical protein
MPVSGASLDNPFKIVYDAIFRLAVDSLDLSRMVKASNKIDLGSETKTDPIKAERITSDFPEIVLISDRADANLHASNTHVSFMREYAWVINVAEYKIALDLLSVEWALFAAMRNWEKTVRDLTWNGETFVIHANLTSLRETDRDITQRRGMRGWAAVWTCMVEMRIRKSLFLT